MRNSWLILGFGLLAPVACSYYDTSLLAARWTSHPDASVDVKEEDSDVSDIGPEQDVEDANVCTLLHPVGPPSADDPSSDEDIAFVVALDTLDFGSDLSGGPVELGFDLDARCTCHGDGESCKRPSNPAEVCDGTHGQDNSAGLLFDKVGKLADNFDTSEWGDNVHNGDWGLLLRISHYNGQLNDTQVRLEWYIPGRFAGPEEETDAGAGADGGGPVPKWDGNDEWPIRSTCLTQVGDNYDLTKPLFYDDNAYVSDGYLVGSVKDGTLHLGEILLQMVGVFIQGKLVYEQGLWRIRDGALAGRWPMSNILGALGQIDDPLLKGTPLCTDAPSYKTIRDSFCAYADVLSNVGSPSTPCDAASVAMGFDAVQAKLGEVVVHKPKKRRCEPDKDPAFDHCP